MTITPTGDVYVDEPWLLMRWDSDHECVFAEWKGFATSAEFQGGLTKAIEVIQEKQALCFVNDTRKLELISEEDQRWIRYTWTPLLVGAGLKRVAVVIARTGLGKLAIQDMFNRRLETRLQSRTFDSIEEAMKWVVGSEKQTKYDP